MKKLIILSLMLITLAMPITASANVIEAAAALILPEYDGDIDNPEVYVIQKGDNYWIVKIGNQFYVFRPNK